MDLWEIENQYYDEGYTTICGTDEAGAGPLAGPVFAAAVILPKNLIITGLTDSKKLTEKRREELFPIICEQAFAYAITSVDEKTIDKINILKARMLAMDMAIKKLSIKPDLALIDGNRNLGIECKNVMIVKGDSRSANIAAASILAKVSRDHFMYEMADKYPEYHFEKHKGYGTKLHYEMIEKYGISPIHRITFLKKVIGDKGEEL